MLTTARPPPTLGASLEKSKRIRGGSISLSLQQVSELVDEGVLENHEQKGVVKDLIISGNEEILGLIQQYSQNGDKKPIQQLVRNYSFHRKSSLDLLGDDLTLEFAELLFPRQASKIMSTAAPPPPIAEENSDDCEGAADGEEEFDEYDVMLLGNEDMHSFLKTPPHRPMAFGASSKQQQQQQHHINRMRSCSLGSTSFFQLPSSLREREEDAMFNMTLEDEDELAAMEEEDMSRSNHIHFFDHSGNAEDDEGEDELEEAPAPQAPCAASSGQRAGRSASLLLLQDDILPDAEFSHTAATTGSLPPPTPIKKAKQQSATSKPIPIPKSKSSAQQPLKKRSNAAAAAAAVPPPPSSPPDDSSSSSLDFHLPPLPTEEDIAYKRSLGIVMTGAYSPESRASRVGRFVDKRDQRVWKKKVKYDVRKNFADSRLRVKGRFVKKEDEEMLREFMEFV